MKYKICEKCEAKLHERTLRCPNCNTLLTDASKIVDDTPETVESEPSVQPNLGNEFDVQISDNNVQNSTAETPKDVKDYIYKAEVRHSLEYTAPLSNFIKVLLTAFSMFPIAGQFIGTFFGIFFSTYDDNDRSTFGKALIFLSVIMFMIYAYNIMMLSEILSNGEISNYLINFMR